MAVPRRVTHLFAWKHSPPTLANATVGVCSQANKQWPERPCCWNKHPPHSPRAAATSRFNGLNGRAVATQTQQPQPVQFQWPERPRCCISYSYTECGSYQYEFQWPERPCCCNSEVQEERQDWAEFQWPERPCCCNLTLPHLFLAVQRFNGLNGRAVATDILLPQHRHRYCFNGLNGRAVATPIASFEEFMGFVVSMA